MTASQGPCQRFEDEAFLAIEKGLPLDVHFESCPDCLAARAAYESLGNDIAAAGSDLEPPPDWQAKVWAQIARQEASRRRRLWTWMLPAGAFAAALLVLLLRSWLPTPEVGLMVAVVQGDEIRRGTSAQPGDRLELEATTAGAKHAELRVYRDDADLVLRCTDQAPCSRRGQRLQTTLELQAIGSYQPMLIFSEDPVPPPTGQGLDADAAAAFESGAHVELGDDIRVE